MSQQPARGALRETGGPPEPDLRQAKTLLLRLLRIPGKSGSERQVADFITRTLRRAGAPVSAIRLDGAQRRSPFGGQVGNLILKLPGAGRPRRLLMAHMDTVPLCVGTRPRIRGKWVVPAEEGTALGADDRAGVAVVLAVATEILRRKIPHPPLTFLWTIQEELGLHGARWVRSAMLGKPGLAFNFDGGSPEKLTIGATGSYRMTIDVRGVASHAGSAPEEGASAIAIASLAIAQLHREGWHGRIQRDGHRGTSNVGVIHGGETTNVVTPHVHVGAEARSHDAAFRRRIVRAIEGAFRKAARSVCNIHGKCGKVDFHSRLEYEAFKLPDDEPCVLAAGAAVRGAGGQPVLAVCDGGLDANWITSQFVPTVTIGCGQRHGHTTAERLNLDEFYLACRIALRLATGTKGQGE